MTTGMGDLPHETPRLHGPPLFLRAAERMRREDTLFFDALAEVLDEAARRAQQSASGLATPITHTRLVRVAEAFLSDPGDPPTGVA